MVRDGSRWFINNSSKWFKVVQDCSRQSMRVIDYTGVSALQHFRSSALYPMSEAMNLQKIMDKPGVKEKG